MRESGRVFKQDLSQPRIVPADSLELKYAKCADEIAIRSNSLSKMEI
jgi:hypothetical protein